MRTLAKYVASIILIMGSLVSIWFLIGNVGSITSILIILSAVFIVSIAKIFAPNFTKKILQKLSIYIDSRHFLLISFIVIIFLGIFIRFTFFFAYSYDPVSDPASFLNAAKSIADGFGLAGNKYVAFFPYLAAYDNILGITIKIFGNPWLATIILNTVFDFCAAAILYRFVRRISGKKSKAPILAFGFWILSPFNIIFSVISLPIIIVNFFIIALIYITYLMAQKILELNYRSAIALSILFGIFAGYGNCFRPIFVITIIAITLFLIYIILISNDIKKPLKIVVSSLIIIFAMFFGIQKINTEFISYQTGMDVASSAGGWSFYVGSNNANTGAWNLEDDAYLHRILENNTDYEAVHNKLLNDGIARYDSYGATGTAGLFIRKLASFASNQKNLYDAEASVTGYKDSILYNIFGIYILTFIIVLFFASGSYLLSSAKRFIANQKKLPIIVFISILMLGLFLSDMFVESQLRYAQVMYPMFIVLGTLGIKDIISDKFK